ncbi:hypothetical protein D3C86_1360680 [compost metagenome]
MRHGVQAHHIGGAERGGLGTAQLGTGQVVDDIERNAELLGLGEHGQDREDADTVGDEVRRVLGAHHALAERGGQEGFQAVEDLGLRGGRRDQFHQMHVARWIEEVHAAEAGLQAGVEAVGQRGNRQPRGIGREDRLRGQVRGHLLVEVVLPVHALGDGFDHHVALAQQGDVIFVVRGADQAGLILDAERRGRELLQVLDGAQGDAVLGAFLGGQVEQHHGHTGVDQVGGNLRPHDAGTQHGDFLDDEIGHARSSVCER